MKLYALQPGEYRCDVCGTVGPWGPGWAWFGSMEMREVTTCSEHCRSLYGNAFLDHDR